MSTSRSGRFLVALGFIGFAAAMLTAAAERQDSVPYDTKTVFRTHIPHLNSGNGQGKPGGGGGNGGGGGGSSAVFGGSPYIVDATSTPTSSVPEAEEHIAVDPLQPNNVVAAISDFSLRGGSNTTKLASSTDNGTTWTESFVPLSGGAPATSDGLVWPYNSDPVVAIDRNGKAYIADLYFNSSAGDNSNGVYVSVGTISSTGLGVTAATTYPVSVQASPSTTVDEDKEWIAVDNSLSLNSGNVYVSWTRFIGNSSDMILFSRSTTGAQTWSAPIQVSATAQNGAVQGSAMAVGPNGEVYVAYEVFFVGGGRRHYITKSTDGGLSFSAPVAASPLFNELSFNSTYRKNSFASIAVRPTDGAVYIVYTDQPSQPRGTGSQVEFARSTNGGASFSAPLSINDSGTGQRLMPSIATDGSGNIHASWFDTRLSSSTATYDIYATGSLDGGNVFRPNARVTAASISAGSASFIGDYGGIAAGGIFAHPAWTSGGFNNGRLQTTTLH
jgi:hypothetical protein